MFISLFSNFHSPNSESGYKNNFPEIKIKLYDSDGDGIDDVLKNATDTTITSLQNLSISDDSLDLTL